MSWRPVTEADLVASLAQNEVDAYRTCGDFEHDPVERQIAAVVAYVRGCIRTGGKARLSVDETLLPDSLVIPAMDYLRYNVLTRKGSVVNESRTNAYEKAVSLFDEIRKGDYIPVSGVAAEDEESANDRATAPAVGNPNPCKRLLD